MDLHLHILARLSKHIFAHPNPVGEASLNIMTPGLLPVKVVEEGGNAKDPI